MKKDEKSAVRAVLFDVDGTLADTERDGHRPAFNAAFRELGLDWEWGVELYGELLAITGGKERIRHFIENHEPAELAREGLDDWIARVHKVKTRHYVEALERGGIPLRPGVARLIRQLREANIKIAIATTTTPENVTGLLKSTLGEDSPGWFDVIGAGDIVPGKKPEPDIYHWVLDRLALTPEQCLAIEDSLAGITSALAAGMKVLAVATTNPGDKLTDAHWVVPTLEVPRAIGSIVSVMALTRALRRGKKRWIAMIQAIEVQRGQCLSP